MAEERWSSEKYQKYLKMIDGGMSPNEALAKIDVEGGRISRHEESPKPEKSPEKYQKERREPRTESKPRYSEIEEKEAYNEGFRSAAEKDKVVAYLEREDRKRIEKEGYKKIAGSYTRRAIEKGKEIRNDIGELFYREPKTKREIARKQAELAKDIEVIPAPRTKAEELARKMFGKPITPRDIERLKESISKKGESAKSALGTTGAFILGATVMEIQKAISKEPKTKEQVLKMIRKEELEEKIAQLRRTQQEKYIERSHELKLAQIKSSQPMFGTTQRPAKVVRRQIPGSNLVGKEFSSGAKNFSLGGSLGGGGFMNMNLASVRQPVRTISRQIVRPLQRQPQVVVRSSDPFGLSGFAAPKYAPSTRVAQRVSSDFLGLSEFNAPKAPRTSTTKKTTQKIGNVSSLVSMGSWGNIDDPVGFVASSKKKKGSGLGTEKYSF